MLTLVALVISVLGLLELQQAANLNFPDRLFKVHGRWRSDSAKDGYVCDKVDSRILVSLNIGL